MNFDFTGRVIANPSKFFDAQMIVNGDPEIGNAAGNRKGSIQDTVGREVLPNLNKPEDISAKLKDLGIEYVLVYKNTPFIHDYEHLRARHDVIVVQDSKNIALYKVR
jgi:hypothetical protein